MSVRPRVLVLSQTVPFPPDGGAWIRTYNLLRALARRFELTILCFERAIAASDGFAFNEGASLRALSQLGHAEIFPIPQRHSRLRFLADHARSLLRGRVFTQYLYESGAFRERLRQLVAEGGYDLVHVDSLDLAAYLPLLQGLPVACTHHNVESALLRRRARADASAAVRAYAAHQAGLMEATERAWCPRVALNIAVSEDDAAALARLAPAARFTIVPNGVDTRFFQPGPDPEGEGLVFVGGANWFPNRDALEYFCRDILPLLRRNRPDLRVTWVGAASEEDRRSFLARHGVELTGYVDDIRPRVRDAACFIAPLRVGGGSRLKILDAWALGKAVVSTSVGCEGLAAQHGRNILVADDPAAFAAAVERVLVDRTLRRELGRAARALVERVYAWDVVGAGLVDAYEALLARSPRPARARATAGG